MTTPTITTVNFHLWKPCNMTCMHCFATYEDLEKGAKLRAEEALATVRELAKNFSRINFVGGEPTLCPFLFPCMALARALGMQVSMVTNGLRLADEPDYRTKVFASLDVLGISVDSDNPETCRAMGRKLSNGRILGRQNLMTLAEAARAAGVVLKINTVVTQANAMEDMSQLITKLRPVRWKIFQVLPVRGQNDAHFESLKIGAEDFAQFVERHQSVAACGVKLVPEDNRLMTGSYAMVGPDGRAYDNVDGQHHYSDKPVYKTGWKGAFMQIRLNVERFHERDGDWKMKAPKLKHHTELTCPA